MKLLTVSVLLFALLALSCAADSQEETATQEPQAEEAATEAVEEESEGATAAPEEEAKEEEQVEGEEQVEEEQEEEEPESDADTSEPSHVVKRATSCPSGWTLYRSRCFRYFSYSYTWAQAENLCTAYGGNLASAPTNTEYDWLRNFIKSKTNSYTTAWIGGSDAEQERVWLWSDGSRFYFRDWCNSRPSSSTSYNCLAMNYSSNCYCGADLPCSYRYPFVCARK